MAVCPTMVSNAQVIDTVLNKVSQQPFNFSVAVPDGNYRVTVTLGNKKKAGQTVVRAESRRHYVDEVVTKKGKFATVEFIVNKHSPVIEGDVRVKLKPREVDYKNWDDSLNLSFCGSIPAVQRIYIEPVTDVTTVFLCGNSTVVDQEDEPWASWGQMITRWFGPQVAIANFAESGLSCTTFLAQLRLDKILSQLKKDNAQGLPENYRKYVYGGCGKSLSCHDICPAGIDVEQKLANSNAVAVWKRFFKSKK